VYRPKLDWHKKVGVKSNLIEGFGHTMYADEKIISKVCLDLLESVTKKQKEEKSLHIKIA